MMTCPNNSEQRTFRFATSAPGVGSVWGTWHSKVPIYTNSGPHLPRIPTPTQTTDPISPGIRRTDTAPDEYDQCVFLRYYTVRKRLGIPKVIKAAAGPHDLDSGGSRDEGSPLGEQSASGPSALSDDSEESGSSVTNPESESDTVTHNTTLVRSFLGLCTYLYSFGMTACRMKGTISMQLQITYSRQAGTDGVRNVEACLISLQQNSGADSALIHHRDITPLREVRSKTAGSVNY